MESLRGYDAWKTRVPDPGTGGETGHGRTQSLWWQSYRFAKRQGPAAFAAWMDEQRRVPLFAGFVKQVDDIARRQKGTERPTADPDDASRDA